MPWLIVTAKCGKSHPARRLYQCVFIVVALAATCLRAADAQNAISFVQEFYAELSIGKSIPLAWHQHQIEYSLAVPRDAPLIALRVSIKNAEEDESAFSGRLSLRVPLRGLAFDLQPEEPSEWIEIGILQQTVLKIDIADYEYTVNIIRSKIASNGQAEHPDFARQVPPRGTLSGLAVQDSLGRTAHMAWFTPRVSAYLASVSENAAHIRLVATPNDPDSELEWRRDGGKWDFLVSGLTSAPARVNPYGWTLFDVRVRSAFVESVTPLVYQITITKDVVCHPKCRSCDGVSFNECSSCYAPLILYRGKCLYTSCSDPGQYFDIDEEMCMPCNPSCVVCTYASAESCTMCPQNRFLLTPTDAEVVGQCVEACPFGYFVQPVSQSCQRSPAGLKLQRFYLRLELRVAAEDYEEDQELPKQILQVAVETLKVSSQDVSFHRWDPARGNLGVDYYFEVENPFLRKEKIAQTATIDDWFAGLPVPVDRVTVLSHQELYPPPPAPPKPPLLQPWMWGLIGVSVTGFIVVYPLYHFHFIRKYWEKTPYKPNMSKGQIFVKQVMDQAKEQHISKAQALAERPR